MNHKVMHKTLKKFFLTTEADDLYTAAILRMEKINGERKKYAQKALEQHFGENILPILALYLVVKENDTENPLSLTEKVANEIFVVGRKRMAVLGRFPFFYWLIQKMVGGVMEKAFPSEGWDIEWLEVSKKQVAFNMHACFYLDVLTAYDVPELTPVFCNLDDFIYENVSPYLRWQRKGTLGRGDTHCDFRFINPKQE